jgi:ABC-type amino acid transport system permease subunit
MDAIQVYASKAMAMTQVDEFWTILAPLAYVTIVPFLNVLIAMASPPSPPRTDTTPPAS